MNPATVFEQDRRARLQHDIDHILAAVREGRMCTLSQDPQRPMIVDEQIALIIFGVEGSGDLMFEEFGTTKQQLLGIAQPYFLERFGRVVDMLERFSVRGDREAKVRWLEAVWLQLHQVRNLRITEEQFAPLAARLARLGITVQCASE